ncbi:hypothetical protein L596_016191 [Steinernema carpocapsae]|uniref:G-protein coupled receptors family 1 profile domain-containing protein n=1 Tax=Steinernema carpocapsae TaxID=34508 RepID=A0A4U5NIG8_STECR|nr:hypothetical protein L596_016191 [Steinernema carpocapsae]
MDSSLALTVTQSNQKQKMARLNLTIGLTSISALLLLFIPDILILFDIGGLAQYEVIFYIIVLNKCVINVFIYTFRHRELQMAFLRPIMRCVGKKNESAIASTDVQPMKITIVRRMDKVKSITN